MSLTIIPKFSGTPIEPITTTKRLSTPVFHVDPSAIALDTAEITDYFYTETECDNLFLKKTGGTIDGSLKIGDSANYVLIDASGNISLNGAATQWGDMRFPATATKQGANAKPDFDYTNLGLAFPQNDESEKVYFVAQFNHDYKFGTAISPHLHFLQTTATPPTFIMQYRWTDNGEAYPGLTTIESSTLVLSYTSGTILQMIEFPHIDPSGITGVSSMMDIILYRKTGDGITGDVVVKEFDIHYEMDGFGSNSEYTK